MSEKIEKTKTKLDKSLFFFSGVVICLLAVMLILNMGTPARVLSFVFSFLFGSFSIFLYICLYIVGYFLLLKETKIKLKDVPIYIDIAFFVFSLGMLTTLSTFMYKDQIAEGNVDYIEIFNSLNYVTEKEYINLFSSQLGGGYIGYSFSSLLTSFVGDYKTVGAIAIIVSVIGALIFLIPTGIKFYKKKTKDKPKQKEAKTVSNELRVENFDVIKEAGNISNPAPKPISNPNIKANTIVNPANANAYAPVSNGYSANYEGVGVFQLAHFALLSNTNTVDNKSPDVLVNQTVTPTLETAEKIETNIKNEQMELDFDAPQVIDEKIVTAKPTFIEPASLIRQEVVNKTPVKTKTKWTAPSSELLEVMETSQSEKINVETAEARMISINKTFDDFGVGARAISYVIGPSVTRFNIEYDSNVSYRAVDNLVEDISRKLGGVSARFEPIVEGSYYSGLEIANAEVTPVSFKDVYEKLPDVKKHPLAIALGKNIQGDVISADFNEFPHALVAGTTGSGKSIFIHSIITTLIMRNSPDSLRLGLIDPKQVEMLRYRDMPHLLCPIITEPDKAKVFFDRLVEEMNDRYRKLAEADGSTNLKEYNEYAEDNGLEKMPYIVVIVDEYGDLVQSNKEIAQPIVAIGQKARACGIHLLIATQSPTTNIITGIIKSNLPTHIALCAANSTQSVAMLGEGGAEALLGRGDMLVQSPIISRVGLVRLQGCFIQKRETSRVVGYLKEHYETLYEDRFSNLEESQEIEGQGLPIAGVVTPSSDALEEKKYQGIKAWVMSNQFMSMSRIQGECNVGFNRARRFFTRLQQEGIVSKETEGNRGSRVLVHEDGDTICLDENNL